MLQSVNQDIEIESYDLEATTAGRVTELYGDVTATAVACQAMARQIAELLKLAEMALESGHRTWGLSFVGWIREDFAEMDLMMASLNADSLSAQREELSEGGRMMMYSHIVSETADLRETFERVNEELEGMEELEDIDDRERRFAEMGHPYIRVCSFYPAFQHVFDSLSDGISNEVWLSTMKVASLMVQRMQDSMIYIVARAEWELDESGPFYEQLKESGRLLSESSLEVVMDRYSYLMDDYNRRLGWQASPALEEETEIVLLARDTKIAPGDFAWGRQEVTFPDGRTVLDDIFLVYEHGGKKVLQLLCEPYPEDFPAEKVITHVEAIFATLIDLKLEELPEWYVGESVDRKMRAIRRAAEGGIHTVTKDMLAGLALLAGSKGIGSVAIMEMVRRICLDDPEVLALLCGFYGSRFEPSSEDIQSALIIRDSPGKEAASDVSAEVRERLSIEMTQLGFPGQSIGALMSAADGY